MNHVCNLDDLEKDIKDNIMGLETTRDNYDTDRLRSIQDKLNWYISTFSKMEDKKQRINYAFKAQAFQIRIENLRGSLK